MGNLIVFVTRRDSRWEMIHGPFIEKPWSMSHMYTNGTADYPTTTTTTTTTSIASTAAAAPAVLCQ